MLLLCEIHITKNTKRLSIVRYQSFQGSKGVPVRVESCSAHHVSRAESVSVWRNETSALRQALPPVLSSVTLLNPNSKVDLLFPQTGKDFWKRKWANDRGAGYRNPTKVYSVPGKPYYCLENMGGVCEARSSQQADPGSQSLVQVCCKTLTPFHADSAQSGDFEAIGEDQLYTGAT